MCPYVYVTRVPPVFLCKTPGIAKLPPKNNPQEQTHVSAVQADCSVAGCSIFFLGGEADVRGSSQFWRSRSTSRLRKCFSGSLWLKSKDRWEGCPFLEWVIRGRTDIKHQGVAQWLLPKLHTPAPSALNASREDLLSSVSYCSGLAPGSIAPCGVWSALGQGGPPS